MEKGKIIVKLITCPLIITVSFGIKEKKKEKYINYEIHKRGKRKVHTKKYYTPISIKFASVKNDTWSMFHSPRCIMGASPVNYVSARSLET